MFEKLAEQLRNLRVTRAAVAPTRFTDPLARRTEWGPLIKGGASFGTQALVQIDSSRLEFRPTPGAIMFYIVFMVMGLGALLGCAFAIMAPGQPPPAPGAYLGLLIGCVFVVAGVSALYSGTAPIVFDRQKGYFWKGRKAPDAGPDRAAFTDGTELSRIHALQLITEFCRGNKSSFYSYELNLVLADGTRLNVVDHGNQGRIREDAAALAAFLNVPVWDAL